LVRYFFLKRPKIKISENAQISHALSFVPDDSVSASTFARGQRLLDFSAEEISGSAFVQHRRETE
jgi:hypothetical protein